MGSNSKKEKLASVVELLGFEYETPNAEQFETDNVAELKGLVEKRAAIGRVAEGRLFFRKTRPFKGETITAGGSSSFMSTLYFQCKSMVPAADNYSDVSQSMTFWRKGQPFYCYITMIGVLWNVALGLW